ncbi:MAG: DNA integrity scanning protein DisA nucleotide-binding domain protein [Verrucomicrobiota bacterium]
MQLWWIYAIDIIICTVVLRIIIGWLLAYPRLIRLLLSLILVLIVGFLVNTLELPFAGLLVLLLLVPVIVILFLSFLPELGRVYQAASRGNLFRPRIFQSDEILPDLAEALIQLRERRIGGLMVFPGNQDEDGLISGGEEVDAKVNRSLLLSLFDPHCPRHDGAIVIRNNRMVRIGAVLPLASAEGKGADLGTRHLAAIGLSERSDSHVLVVSEERGTISHAINGTLKEIHFKDSVDLRNRLSRLLGEDDGAESTRKKKWLPVFLWVMAILFSALGSWQVDVIKKEFKESFSETVYVQQVEATIQYTLDPETQFVANWETTSAKLSLRVPDTIRNVNETPSIVIDLNEEAFNKVDIQLQSSMVTGLPEGVVVDSITPDRIEFTLAEVKRVEAPLGKAEVTGLGEGLKLKEVTLARKTIPIKVRDIKWKNSKALEIQPVNLSDIVEAGQYTFPVQLILPATVEREEDEIVEITVIIEGELIQLTPGSS